jgi:outer membrane lipoprotein-sorting protein
LDPGGPTADASVGVGLFAMVQRFKFLLVPLALVSTCLAPVRAAASAEDAQLEELIAHMHRAYAAAGSFSADFVYTVESDVRHQRVEGHARLMKPNLARLTFARMAEPAFPNLIASDGASQFTFVSEKFKGGWWPQDTPINVGFRAPSGSLDGVEPSAPARHAARAFDGPIPTNRTFAPGPHDPVLAARQASGLAAGGGTIIREKVSSHGRELRLWDSLALQAFFDVRTALRANLYTRDLTSLRVEGTRVVDGISYTVIFHRFKDGNIEGGARSDFDQRVFVAPDGIIHRYELGFTSNGKPGLQVMQLRNVKLNEPMTREAFAFAYPSPH